MGLPVGLILLTGSSSTQQTIFTFSIAGDSIDFTLADSCNDILGFDSRIAPATPQAASYNEYSDNGAEFNRVNSYGIRSNIVSSGLPLNNQAIGLIASIPITATPGKLIIYEPYNPIRVDANELIGNPRSNLEFTLIDQVGRNTPTNSEHYNFILTIRWNRRLEAGGL